MNNLAIQTDDQLVRLFMSGCNEAFDILLQRYKDKLYSYISYLVRNDDMADDLFQETFVKAIMTIRQNRYKANGHFYAWLTRIAHNLLIDQFRTEKNEACIYEEEAECTLLSHAVLSDTFRENEIITEQVLKDVRNLMEHLPDNQREVVYMRFYQNLSFKEISEQTGVSINTALGRMHYAIQNMRKLAQEHQISLCIE